MPRSLPDVTSPGTDSFAAFWSEPVPGIGTLRQTRLVRAWEGAAQSWRNPEAPAESAVPAGPADDALDRAQRALVRAGRPSIAAYARFGARAVR